MFSSQQQQVPTQSLTSGDIEKLLIVLLVAFGTVCLLTNLLVLLILRRLCKQDNLPFRYRLITSQSLSGVVTSSILLFPLKILSYTLSEATSHPSEVPSSPQVNFTLLMSPHFCFMLSSVPVVFSAVSSSLHSVVLYLEQAMRPFFVSYHKASSRYNRGLTFLTILLWIPSILLSISPLARESWISPTLMYEGPTTCRISNLWTPDYGNFILSTYLFLTAMIMSAGSALKVAGKLVKHRRITTLSANTNPIYDDSLPLCSGDSDASGLEKQSYKTTMVIRTLESTPLDLSHSKSALINFSTSVMLTLPAVLYYCHFTEEASENINERVALLVEERHVAWTHLTILLNGSLGPVLHLLSDDLLCSKGLEMLTEFFDFFNAPAGWSDIGDSRNGKPRAVDEIKIGFENYPYEDEN